MTVGRILILSGANQVLIISVVAQDINLGGDDAQGHRSSLTAYLGVVCCGMLAFDT